MGILWRILYRIYRLVSGARHWAARRFTTTGLALVAGLVLLAMVGADTENTVAYQGSAVLFFLLLMAIAARWFFKLPFSVTRELPRFGTVGQPLRYRVAVKNLSPTTQHGLTLLEDLADPRPTFSEWRDQQISESKRSHSFRVSKRRPINPYKPVVIKEVSVTPLPPGRPVDVPVELTPLRRGVLRFTSVTLARTDPLSLFRALTRATATQSALILPRRYPLPPIALPGTMKYQEGGVAQASQVGQSDEFVSLREYRRGDPVRHIHWRSWAKFGKPIVKEFQDEFFVRHALILDTFTDQPHSEIFEEAVSVAASFASTLQTQESLLDLLFVGSQAYCFTAGRGLAHADQMLEILASVRPCRDQPFKTLEHLLLGHVGMVSGCVCVLLAWDAERKELVKKLKSLGVPVLVLVIVGSGEGEFLEGGPMQDEPDRFHTLELGRIERGLAEL